MTLHSLKAKIRDQKFYRRARRIKWRWQGKLKQFRDPYQRIVSLQPAGTPKGNVLLSYVLDPFLLPPGQAVSNAHSNHWESVLMARTFLELNYCVDVIHWTNSWFEPEKPYSFFIDSRHNLQRLAPLLNRECVKIVHIDICHLLFANLADAQRLVALQQRRGVTLRPVRFTWPNLAIEFADCGTILGNQFTSATYEYANKPLYPVPIIPSAGYPWLEGKDFEVCRKRFLWFGSSALVRKGLDLVLEAFAGMPDCHLTVCGPIQGEPDFEQAYRKELYETPNIETLGWVDIDGPRFRAICENSAGLIFPSCAEGQCGSVVTCMHAGLIPVISYECGVDVQEFGLILPDCSIPAIQKAIQDVSKLPASQLEQRARQAWEYARANHSREKFAQEFRKVIEHLQKTGAREPAVQNKLAPTTAPVCGAAD